MEQMSTCGVRNYRDRFRMKPDDDFTDWDVTTYGTVVENREVKIYDRYPVQMKVYRYRDRFFMELWNCGIRCYYGEVIGYD